MRKTHVGLILIIIGIVLVYVGWLSEPTMIPTNIFAYYFLFMSLSTDLLKNKLVGILYVLGFLLFVVGFVIIIDLAVKKIRRWFLGLRD